MIKNKTIFSAIHIFLYSLMLVVLDANASNVVKTHHPKGVFLKVKSGLYFSDAMNQEDHISKNKGGYTLASILGFKVKSQLALDIEYNYRHQDAVKIYDSVAVTTTFKKWQVTSQTLMGNASYYLYRNTKINPFIRAGVGISRNKSGVFSVHARDNSTVSYSPGKTTLALAWQLGGGVSLDVIENMRCELEYMFINRGDFKTKPIINTQTGITKASITGPSQKGTIKDNQLSLGIVFDL